MNQESYVVENIKRLCLEKGLLYKELCEKADISRDTLSTIFKGTVTTRYDTIARIAGALEVTVAKLEAKPTEMSRAKYDLKTLCRLRGTTLNRLAEENGISPSTVRNVARGKAKPYSVYKVAKALGVKVEEILIPPNQ